MLEPASVISTICGIMTSYFGGLRSGTATSRPRNPSWLGIVQGSPCRNSHILTVGSWLAGAGSGSAVGDSSLFRRIINGVFGTNPMTTVQITISDALAKEAAAEGLLEPGSIETILRERLAAARIAKMQATRQKLAAAGTPPMTAEEIEAEIKAYRAERRRAAGA